MVEAGLDIGCNEGRNIPMLLERCEQGYGTDLVILPEMESQFPSVIFESGTIPEALRRVPRVDVIDYWRVHHNVPVEEQPEALEEISRVLKPGGVLLCALRAAPKGETSAFPIVRESKHPVFGWRSDSYFSEEAVRSSFSVFENATITGLERIHESDFYTRPGETTVVEVVNEYIAFTLVRGQR